MCHIMSCIDPNKPLSKAPEHIQLKGCLHI
jgi:hypothetical protein